MPLMVYQYVKAQRKVDALYKDQRKWTQVSMMNTAGTGYFTSDRAIDEYASKIWHISPTTRPVIYNSVDVTKRKRARSLPDFSEDDIYGLEIDDISN